MKIQTFDPEKTPLLDANATALAEDVLDGLKRTAQKVIRGISTNNQPVQPGGTEQVFDAYFRSLDINKVRRADTILSDTAQSNKVKEPVLVLVAGANTGFHTQASVREQEVPVTPIQAKRTFNPDSFLKHLENLAAAQNSVQTLSATAQAANTLEVRLKSMHCSEETGPDWSGSDEIRMSGALIDAYGSVYPLGNINLGGGWDSGNTRNYDLLVNTINFSYGPAWPRAYQLVLALAEKEQGGFGDFIAKLLQDLQDKVRQKLAEYLGVSVGAVVGASIGGTLGTLIGPVVGTVIGAVVGAAIGYVFGKAIGWIKNLFKDDIFNPVTIGITVNGPAESVLLSSYNADFLLHGDAGAGHYIASFSFVPKFAQSSALYATVWETKQPVGESVIWDWAVDDLIKHNNDMRAQNFEMVNLDGFMISPDQIRYAANWRQMQNKEEERSIFGWTFQDFIGEFNKNIAAGYDMTAIDTSLINGNSPRYHAVFQKRVYSDSGIHIKVPGHYEFNLKVDDFLSKANTMHTQGHRINLFDSYLLGDVLYCSAKWKTGNQAQYITIGRTLDQWYTEYLQKSKEVYQPVLLDVYEVSGSVRVNTIWEPGNTLFGTIIDLATQQLAQGAFWKDNTRIKKLTVSK